MLFYRFILRPLLKERLRASLAVVGVALGVAVMLAIQLANQGALRGFNAALDAVSGKASLEIVSPPLGMDEALIPQMSWLREFGVATPVIEADVTADFTGQKATLRVIGVDALRDPALRDYALMSDASAASGMELMSFLERPHSLVLAGGFAATRYGLRVGDDLQLIVGDQFQTCTIAAIIGDKAGTGLAAQSIAIMDIANAQDILGRPGRIDRLELRLHEGENVDVVERVLRERLPKSLSIQRPQRRGAAVEKMLAAFHFNLTMLSGIALVVGLFLIYNTVAVAVMTRRQEIGMARTLGVTRGQILACFAGEALLLGTAGTLLGVPLAKGLATGAIHIDLDDGGYALCRHGCKGALAGLDPLDDGTGCCTTFSDSGSHRPCFGSSEDPSRRGDSRGHRPHDCATEDRVDLARCWGDHHGGISRDPASRSRGATSVGILHLWLCDHGHVFARAYSARRDR